MCHCYEAKCAGCGVEISVHVGDFSVAAENIKVFCHKKTCRAKAMLLLLGGKFGSDEEHIVVASKRNNGKRILFVVDWPRGIHVNE